MQYNEQGTCYLHAEIGVNGIENDIVSMPSTDNWAL
jgi:hypothetical protein